MNHEEFQRFSRIMRGGIDAEEPEETEEERQRRLRLERAKRLKAQARGNRGRGLPIGFLADMPLLQLWTTLGFSSGVLVDELQRERSDFNRLNEIGPITLDRL